MTFVPEPLAALLHSLDQEGYAFTSVTPATHRLMLARRAGSQAHTLRDIFGWGLEFARSSLGGELLGLLEEGGALERRGDSFRSRVGVSSLSGRLFLHEAVAAETRDGEHFGPGTYRMARFVETASESMGQPGHLVALGSGIGAIGIGAAGQLEAARVTLADDDAQALALAEANAMAAGIDAATIEGGLAGIDGDVDLIIAQVPFALSRASRSDLAAVELARDALARLEPGGTLLLTAQTAIVDSEDHLLASLAELADEHDLALRYEELDPDVLGEQLERPDLVAAGVERIAAVGAVLTRA